MAGTGWQSSDLLSRFNAMAGRPTGDAITDVQKYQGLADAQETLIARITSICGNQQVSAPTAMTTADGGATWTFGVDGNGYASYLMGARIYPTLSAVPDYPWQPGVDYLDEGVQIRMPNNLKWTGNLYFYGVVGPQALSATVQPVIQPPPMRILIVIEAVRSFSEQFVRNDELVTVMDRKWDREFANYMTMIRRHLRGNRNRSVFGWLAGVGIGRPGLTNY